MKILFNSLFQKKFPTRFIWQLKKGSNNNEKFPISVIPSNKEILSLEEIFRDMTDKAEANKEENEYWDKKINEEYKKHVKRFKGKNLRQHFAEKMAREIMKDPDIKVKDMKGDEYLLYQKVMQKIEHAIKDKDVIGSSGRPVMRLKYPRSRILSSEEMESYADNYLDYLAKELNTPEKIGKFLNLYFSYTKDTPNNNIPTMVGTPKNYGEYWQRPQETVWRMAYGEMLGDCDDYALLAKEILTRWKPPKNVHVMRIPNHAICIWVEKNQYGKWDANTLGTYGLDQNGNRKSYDRFGDKIKTEYKAEREKGYSTIDKAVNSVLMKYDKPGLGIEHPQRYRVEKGGEIKIMYVPEKGERYTYTFSLDLFDDRFNETLRDNLSDDGNDYLDRQPYYEYQKTHARALKKIEMDIPKNTKKANK